MAKVLFALAGAVLFVTFGAAGTPDTGDVKRVSGGRAEMFLVPAATFEMGIESAQIPAFQSTFKLSHSELFEVAVPRHRVSVSSFWIDKKLVTKAEFKRFIDAVPEWRKEKIAGALHNGNYLREWTRAGYEGQGENPVVNVSWFAAVAYCRWAGKRLPTEAEWEYAARGGLDNPLFPWGNEPVDDTRANYSSSGIGTTTPVGKYPANGYGLYDMAGNVWQYVADEWAPYPSQPHTNPIAGGSLYITGSDYMAVKSRRVIRGGSFGGAPVNMWVEFRDSHPPDGAREFVGFRCASSADKR